MATVNYITPITDRTRDDVEYARQHQDDLVNKNKGAWNYTDANRVCNNLKYAAEYMYEQGFLSSPFPLSIKLDWKETDIITYETLNSMIVNTINNLKTYARPDLAWYPISTITNMDYHIANRIEQNIHYLATQEPIPPDKYKLTIINGTGSGEYEPNTMVTIQANEPAEGYIFDRWSGNYLEYIADATKSPTTYTMPHRDVTLVANYTDKIPHTLKLVTYSGTTTKKLLMGEVISIEADPAPDGKVFGEWSVSPDTYKDNFYEPAASTHFVMPNEDVTVTAIYIDKRTKAIKSSKW